ncbi:EamA-like transporter family protein [Marinomonas gallaica]|uniref:EamA-like transporter family protein n=1 Tax=Marinomonas gallaica TaxID=1806667 RepID=A0A1C3JW00_9GAMM|nr:EamA family transporter RarD [Marinomonas gallaica]SBT19302.1 EamA-like transporter family protein [Marinomonas gallaica]SBT22874.1 EamA-like transporter family protein [Marinomonas gallaica]
MSNMDSTAKSGMLYGITAFLLWSIAPLYFKTIDHIPALDILSHRILWSFVVVVILMTAMRKWRALKQALSTKVLLAVAVSSVLIAVNWGTYIYAVNSEQLLSASLGYYINPLVSIVLGMVFFKDRLDRPKQWAAWLCLLAVVFEVIQFGRLPWIALTLALSFGLYGLVRKKIALDSFMGMTLETAILMPYALSQLYWFGADFGFMQSGQWASSLLLMAAGPVTMVPLMCFAAAANRISLVTLGFFQYIGPSAMFLLAVFLYDEPLSSEKLVTFGLIWAALAMLIVSSIKQLRKQKQAL